CTGRGCTGSRSPTTTPGALPTPWSGRPPARRQGTTSRRSHGSAPNDPPSTCTTRTSPRAECARASEPIFPVADRSLSRRADHAVARGRARYAAVTEGRVTSSRSGAPCVRPGRRLRPLARSLVDRMARAGQHHRGRAQLHGRIVHVTGHGLPGTFDTQHAMIQDLLYLKRVRHRRSLSGLMARPVPCRVLVTPVP